MTDNTVVTFPFKKIVTMGSPYKHDGRIVYHAFVSVNDLPDSFPTTVNPREVNTRTKVFHKIKDGLYEDNDSFFINNRGMLVSVKAVNIDRKHNVLSLNFGNEQSDDINSYGVLDGGHTYEAIKELHQDKKLHLDQFVHLEIVTHIDSVDELAGARNTSVQVADKAIAELSNKFDFIKDAIKDESYADKVAYKQNEDTSLKPLDSVDFVRLMFAFDIFKFDEANSSKQPIQAYNGKAAVLRNYLKEFDKHSDQSANPYYKLAQLLPDMTGIYDLVEGQMGKAYTKRYGNGHFGSVKGVESSSTLSKYYGNSIDYRISGGLLFPIVAAFRADLGVNSAGSLAWKVDPEKIWEKTGDKLVGNTIEMLRSVGNNPQVVGKTVSLWSQNFDSVRVAILQLQVEELQKKAVQDQ